MAKHIHTGTNQLGKLNTSDDLLVCRACGTQYNVSSGLDRCRICDDPRQYVPPTGQSFTTLGALRADPAKYELVIEQDPADAKIWAIHIEPKTVGIGQRAFLIQTPHGNILWDCVCFLDDAAVQKINSLGGLSAIIISHPHFWTTWADWSRTFNNIPVYLAGADQQWLNRRPDPKSGSGSESDSGSGNLRLLHETHTTLVPGVTAIIAGGHFPGSMALHTDAHSTTVPALFHADTIYAVPNAQSPQIPSDPHATSYAFMWSYPNMIPLAPDAILGIWRALKPVCADVKATYGFTTVRWRDGDAASIAQRILRSAKICVRNMGWVEHEIHTETDA